MKCLNRRRSNSSSSLNFNNQIRKERGEKSRMKIIIKICLMKVSFLHGNFLRDETIRNSNNSHFLQWDDDMKPLEIDLKLILFSTIIKHRYSTNISGCLNSIRPWVNSTWILIEINVHISIPIIIIVAIIIMVITISTMIIMMIIIIIISIIIVHQRYQ